MNGEPMPATPPAGPAGDAVAATAGMPSPDEPALRRALLDTARAMNGVGINHGKAGNLSVRAQRGARDGLLVTPSGLPYDRATPDDLVWLALDVDAAAIEHELVAGTSLPGMPSAVDGALAPSSEWRFHRDILASRADAHAVVHAHGGASAALSCLPRVQRDGVPAFHYMVAAAGGRDLRCASYATFGTQALSDAALQALDGRRACLLAHHGLIAIGRDLDAALALAVEVEWLAATYARVLALGEPALLPNDEMDRVIARFATYGRPRDR